MHFESILYCISYFFFHWELLHPGRHICQLPKEFKSDCLHDRTTVVDRGRQGVQVFSWGNTEWQEIFEVLKFVGCLFLKYSSNALNYIRTEIPVVIKLQWIIIINSDAIPESTVIKKSYCKDQRNAAVIPSYTTYATSQWIMRSDTHLFFWHNVKKSVHLKFNSCQLHVDFTFQIWISY